MGRGEILEACEQCAQRAACLACCKRVLNFRVIFASVWCVEGARQGEHGGQRGELHSPVEGAQAAISVSEVSANPKMEFILASVR